MTRVILAMLCLSLAACADQPDLSRSEQTRRMAQETFGGVSTKGIDEDGDGVGLSMFRVFSEKPMPNRFGKMAPERFDNALVLDVAVDVKIEDRFPLYRIGIEPHKIPDHHRRSWPSHVRIDPARDTGAPLVARLPRDREPDETGVIWTPWTYCADCFGLADIQSATPGSRQEAFAAMMEATKASRAKDGGPAIYTGNVRFLDIPGYGILQGEAAVEMAGNASDVLRDTESRLEKMAPAREDYDHMIEEFSAGASPENELLRLCGTYAPNLETRDPEVEAQRIAAYQQCGYDAIYGVDTEVRGAFLAALEAEEARLARQAGLDARDRIIVPDVGEEIIKARKIIAEAKAMYEGLDMVEPSRAEPVRGPAIAAPLPPEVGDLDETEVKVQDAAVEVPEANASKPVNGSEPLAIEPPNRRIHFVARLLPNGANLVRGDGGASCIKGLECEIGSVVPLIGAVEYCAQPGEVTQTTSGWGLVVQRYLPKSRKEELSISIGDSASQVHEVFGEDEETLEAGLRAMRELKTPEGARAFFTSYQAFYIVNTEGRECRDQWRDAGRAKVLDNPDAVISIPSEEDVSM